MKALGAAALFLILAAAGPARAAVLNVGLVGGTNAVYFSGDTPDDADFAPRTGFGGGLHLEWEASPKFRVVTQPMVLTRSPTVEFDLHDENDPEATEDYKGHLDYVAVPVLARYVFAPGKLGVFVNGGAEYAMLSGATLESPDGSERDIENVLVDHDVSVLLGIGLAFPLGPFHASVEARHAFGLTDIAVEDPLQGPEDVVWKSRSSGLLFGITYSLFGR